MQRVNPNDLNVKIQVTISALSLQLQVMNHCGK